MTGLPFVVPSGPHEESHTDPRHRNHLVQELAAELSFLLAIMFAAALFSCGAVTILAVAWCMVE